MKTLVSPLDWKPTRSAGLRRLTAFVPQAGRTYAAKRNFDYGAGLHTSVSTLSPYIRHRLITENEVVAAVLQVHSASAAEKFVQEVCWRTYWKGWLEQRPQVWTEYLDEVAAQRATLREDDALAADIAAAERGDTFIECFDAWARELSETGYLHNHARMWFASIWIFTLKLPWALGADFFLRHLLDGDPASNTLSWRWVAGLHTRGKTYLARPDNIAEYTAGKFQPGRDELAAFALPLGDDAPLERVPLRQADVAPKGARVILLVTEEDLSPETWPLSDVDVCGVALFIPDGDSGQLSPLVRAFKAVAMVDAETRAAAHWGQQVARVTTSAELIAFAANQGAAACVTTAIPVGLIGPEIDSWATACQLAGTPLLQIARRWDSLFWPHATAGFFKLKERIPGTLAKLDLAPGERSL
jgi:deoxyribodipyrimidine photo-lyase